MQSKPDIVPTRLIACESTSTQTPYYRVLHLTVVNGGTQRLALYRDLAVGFIQQSTVKIFCSPACACSWSVLSTKQLYIPMHATNWRDIKLYGDIRTFCSLSTHLVHIELLLRSDRCRKNSIRCNAHPNGNLGTNGRPSCNRFLNVTQQTNLIYSFTVPSVPLAQSVDNYHEA